MPLFVNVLVRCSGAMFKECVRTCQTQAELYEETNDECSPTGLLILRREKIELPEGWNWGRYGIGVYCPEHQKDGGC